MKELLAASTRAFKENTLVMGRVVQKRGHEILVDIGYKSEGAIPLDQFDDAEAVQVGDEIEVLLEKLEDDEGSVQLSRQKAAQKQNWDKIVQIFHDGGTLTGKIKSAVKGGLTVALGVEAFLPASQIDLVAPKNLKEYEGMTIECKIIKINEERKNIVVSRRELIEAERSKKRSKLLGEIQKGAVVKGTVKNITDFGAFIDLDGLDGLLHVTDMSWSRISHPSEMVKIGDPVEVVVLSVDLEKERVSLGLKQRTSNPWDQILEKYPVQAKVRGKVTNLVPYGAFVQIEPGVEGMIHVSEISWTKRVARPADVLSVGQEVDAVILDINKDDQKISLSLRQLDNNPWDEVPVKYPPGAQVKGVVRNLTAYGAFVELEEGIDGMIHVSDLSWTRKVNHPSEVLKKGDTVEAVVLEIDRPNQRISLGVRQLADDPWKDIETRYKIGDVVAGKVSKLATFGAFVELEGGIDGLVHISQIAPERIEKVKDALKVDQEVRARVVKIDKAERRIGLSIKAADYSSEDFERERQTLEVSKPADDLGSLEHAFDQASESQEEEDYRPGQSKE